MSDEQTPKAKPRVRWVRVLLFTSLALNLLIVGMIGGAFWRNGGPPGVSSASSVPLRDLGYGPYGHALSRQDRQKIGHAMAQRSRALKANREEVHAQIVTLLAALRMTPYDHGAVRTIVTEQQARLLDRQVIGRDLLLDHINSMDDDVRVSYARRLERSFRHMMGGK